jgi:hypothetical protein
MVSNCQHLSEIALYQAYTGDPTNILGRYHTAIMALVSQLKAVRAKALRLPSTSPAYGIPTGNTVECVPPHPTPPLHSFHFCCVKCQQVRDCSKILFFQISFFLTPSSLFMYTLYRS